MSSGYCAQLQRLWHAVAEAVEACTRGVFLRKLARERQRAHGDWMAAALCTESI